MIEAIAFAGKLTGSYLTGMAKKKQADKIERAKRERINRSSYQQRQDLSLETEAMMSGMSAAMGSSGSRMGSSTFAELHENEGFKYNQRRERILQGEKDAIEDAASERRYSRDSANLGMAIGMAESFTGDGPAEFLDLAGKGFNYAADALGTVRRSLTGQTGWNRYPSLENSGFKFQNMSGGQWHG